jgi:putative transposase
VPGRNTLKIYISDTYYHLYNRGVDKGLIFTDADDYAYFEWLLARSLSPSPVKDKKGRNFTWLRGTISLHAYCLMPNHFHIFVHQGHERGISMLMSTILTAYTGYFNKRHTRRGPLFENTYRAVPIISDAQLQHITRYIHLNHHNYKVWPYSSYADYLQAPRSWVESEAILGLFGHNAESYRQFVLDYEDAHKINQQIKHELADYL